ncbi:MAG: hypothetical protein ACE5G1_01260 [bacterium]
MVFSLLFFFAPGIIVKMSQIGNRLVFTDYRPVEHRKLSGVILLAISLVMFYIGVTL